MIHTVLHYAVSFNNLSCRSFHSTHKELPCKQIWARKAWYPTNENGSSALVIRSQEAAGPGPAVGMVALSSH